LRVSPPSGILPSDTHFRAYYQQTSVMRHNYPIFLHATDMPCLVVGGGEVAERKVLALLESGAKVAVVAPEVTEAVSALAAAGKIDVTRREAQARRWRSGSGRCWRVWSARSTAFSRS
jgi:siroheme synthase (precorrin-2 oxidase/ferrochelatase)